MIYKGNRYQKSRSLGYRMAQEGDKYLPETPDSEPKQIESNYVVIVKLKDCLIKKVMELSMELSDAEQEDLFPYPWSSYNADKAPAIPCEWHSLTNLVYTPTHAYLVEDGQVYSRKLKCK